jgi:adenylosuccinate synthase
MRKKSENQKKLLEKLEGVKTIGITCRQLGDTGKGKVVDMLATEWADVIARGTGGDNAGHTIVFGSRKLITHLVPSGILHDVNHKVNVIGSDTVIYPKTLVFELAEIKKMGISYNHLQIAYNAKLITPAEILLDRLSESVAGKGKIGSTGKGIGPAYADYVNRQGLILNDIINPRIFYEKLKRHLDAKVRILRNYDQNLIKQIMNHEHLEYGIYYNEKEIFDIDEIYESYINYGCILKPFIKDTDKFMRDSLGKLNILLEGSQGDLLSIKHGTYPFVTSSDCTLSGLAQGVRLQKSDVDLSLGIIKFPYMTRVGAGPFPTELGGQSSDEWCNGGKADRNIEKANYGTPSVNDENEFLQGIAIRQAGDEYGATTGRPRRIGWLDLPLLRYVMGFNSPDVVLTKIDVLNECKIIKICTCYEYIGTEPYYIGSDRVILRGENLDIAIVDSKILSKCRSVYRMFPGWNCTLKGCQKYEDLPKELRKIIEFVEVETGINIKMISIGADREDTIIM